MVYSLGDFLFVAMTEHLALVRVKSH
jgi:hypothetical protein